MRLLVLFLFGTVAIYACSILPVRFEANGDAWCRLAGDNSIIQDAQPCSLALGLATLANGNKVNGVYASSQHNYMVVADVAPYDPLAAPVGNWVRMPRTATEGADRATFDVSVRNFYARLGRISTNNLLSTIKYRLLNPMNRDITLVTDGAAHTGLPNVHGVSCYMNTAIQMLYAIPTFRHRLAELVGRGAPDATMASHLNSIFDRMEKGALPDPGLMHAFLSILAPYNPHNYGQLGHFRQADSLEAVRDIVRVVEGELQRYLPPGSPSVFRDLLYTWHDRLRFSAHTRALVNNESVDEIGLRLEGVELLGNNNQAELPLGSFLNAILADSRHGNHILHHQIKDFPPYLFMSTPRFSDVARAPNVFSFPLRLDLAPRVHNPDRAYVYELIGVGNHSGGATTSSGHYTAQVRHPDSNWYDMNDSSATPIARPVGLDLKSVDVSYVLYRRVLQLPAVFTPLPLPLRAPVAAHQNLVVPAPPVRHSGNGSGCGGSGSGGGGGGGGGGGSSKSGSNSSNSSSPTKQSPPPVPRKGEARSLTMSPILALALFSILLI